VATLAPPNGAPLFSGPAVSPDGRFVAAPFWSGSTGSPKFVIGVWDLKDSLAQPAAGPIAP